MDDYKKKLIKCKKDWGVSLLKLRRDLLKPTETSGNFDTPPDDAVSLAPTEIEPSYPVSRTTWKQYKNQRNGLSYFYSPETGNSDRYNPLFNTPESPAAYRAEKK